MKGVLAAIEYSDYAVQTINDFRRALRKFFKWLHGEMHRDDTTVN